MLSFNTHVVVDLLTSPVAYFKYFVLTLADASSSPRYTMLEKF